MSKETFTFDGFEPANTTPVPDVLFDKLLPELSESELKILLYIIRRTAGFKKPTDAISLSQFQGGITKKDGEILDRGCGIKDRTTIIKGLASLEKKGCIHIDKSDSAQGDKATSVYRVRFRAQEVVGKPDYPVHLGSGQTRLPLVGKPDYGSGQNALPVVGNSDPQETVIQLNSLQETDRQERENASAIAPTRAPAVSLAERENETNGIPANGILASVPLGSTRNGAVPEHPLPTPDTTQAKGLTNNGDEQPVNDDSDSALPAAGGSLHLGHGDTLRPVGDTERNPPDAPLRATSAQTGTTASGRGQATNGQLSEQTSSALSQDGAARTSPSEPRASGGRKPREKPPVKPTQPAKEPEPDFVLTDLQMAFWQLWCEVWFNAGIPQKVNETAYNHVKVLAPLIKTDEDMKSLTDYARKELAEREGVKRKRVYLGNCVTSYPGWKQAQRTDEPAPNGLPPQMTREQRKAMPVW